MAVGYEGLSTRVARYQRSSGLRGLPERINYTQIRLDLRNQIGQKDMTIGRVFEQALQLEDVTRIEEEEQTPKVAIIRMDETKGLVEAVTKLVNQLSVEDKQHSNRRNQRENEAQKQDRVISDRRCFSTAGPSHRHKFFGRDEPSRRNDGQDFKCRACGQEGNSEEFTKLSPMWKFPTLEKKLSLQK